MLVLNDFYCNTCDLVFEELHDNTSTVATVDCAKCGLPSQKVMRAVRFKLDGTDPAFPTEWDRWAKKREQKLREERKQAESHGDA